MWENEKEGTWTHVGLSRAARRHGQPGERAEAAELGQAAVHLQRGQRPSRYGNRPAVGQPLFSWGFELGQAAIHHAGVVAEASRVALLQGAREACVVVRDFI